MKALMRPSSSISSIIRKSLITLLLFSWLAMPELLWQKLSFITYKLGLILHLVYEAWAFLLEEALMHSAGMSKFYAQMTVFYISLLMGLGIMYLLWRRLPFWMAGLKNRFEELASELKFQLFKTWICLSMWQKLKFMLIHLMTVAGVFTIMLG